MITQHTRLLVCALLFLLCFVVLRLTMVPTLYALDSAEFVVGAWTLGFIHSPGYPLYLLLLHVFMYVSGLSPDVAGNLLSVLALALTAPFLFLTLSRLINAPLLAAAVTLFVIFSYRLWSVGLFAEIYAPQLLSLTVCAWLLSRQWRRAEPPSLRAVLVIGLAYGVAVAVNPISILFAPGMVAVFLSLHVPFKWSAAAGALGALFFLATLFYFPLRAGANPESNRAGQYNADGVFEPIDLQTLDGIMWMISGRQFSFWFFSEGIIPNLRQLGETLALFASNYLGGGLIIGGYGVYVLWRDQRRLLWIWLIYFIPYTYFYTTYGATDKATMFSPVLMLFAVPLAFGTQAALANLTQRRQIAVAWIAVAVMFIVNLPLLNLSRDTSVRERAERLLAIAPPDVHLFTYWVDMTPLEYMQVVEGRRDDIRLYDSFLFSQQDLRAYVQQLTARGETVWVLKDVGDDIFVQPAWEQRSILFSDPNVIPYDYYIVSLSND
jgi:hypothetical protein